MFIHCSLDLLYGQGLGLFHEILKIAQRQVIETHGAQLPDDIGVACGRQWEATGQLTLGVVQFLLRRAGLEVVGQHVFNQAQGAAAHFGAGLQVDHERTTYLHRRETGVNAVGQAALLTHFAHQAGAETTTAEDLVAQGQGGVVRVGAVDAQLREQ